MTSPPAVPVDPSPIGRRPVGPDAPRPRPVDVPDGAPPEASGWTEQFPRGTFAADPASRAGAPPDPATAGAGTPADGPQRRAAVAGAGDPVGGADRRHAGHRRHPSRAADQRRRPRRPGAGGALVGLHLAGHHHRVRPAVRGAQAAGRGGRRPGSADRRQVRGDAGGDRRASAWFSAAPACCWGGDRQAIRCGCWPSCCSAQRHSSGLALLLGGTLRAEAVLAVANLLWLVFVAVGGIIVALDQSPAGLRTVGELTPSGAMSQALRAVLQDGSGAAGAVDRDPVGVDRRGMGRHRTVVQVAVMRRATERPRR